jgi:hypothetical protein
MRKLPIVAASLTALTTATHANEEDQQRPIILESPLTLTALLAEYLTSCGGKATPEVEKVALKIIARTDHEKWLETALRFHTVRDEAPLAKFCLDTRAELDDMLEPIDPHEDKPPPGELDLSPLNRRPTP